MPTQQLARKQTCCNKICPSYKLSNVPSSQFRNHLCKICQEQYDKQQYCIYCQQIYYQSTDDGKQWIMCDKCQRWVHTDCADIQVKGQHSEKVVYKCIKCKKINQPQTVPNRKRGPIPQRNNQKIVQKRSDIFLNNIDFYWQLKPEEIAEDIQKIQSLLN